MKLRIATIGKCKPSYIYNFIADEQLSDYLESLAQWMIL